MRIDLSRIIVGFIAYSLIKLVSFPPPSQENYYYYRYNFVNDLYA